ncbi:hypothetical protein EDC04DRAFT_2767598 [Pisolithus marmoratus]|nr:hypothetical protein EDC04DRAFT_2767598 [Pisolithus marmoratus]
MTLLYGILPDDVTMNVLLKSALLAVKMDRESVRGFVTHFALQTPFRRRWAASSSVLDDSDAGKRVMVVKDIMDSLGTLGALHIISDTDRNFGAAFSDCSLYASVEEGTSIASRGRNGHRRWQAVRSVSPRQREQQNNSFVRPASADNFNGVTAAAQHQKENVEHADQKKVYGFSKGSDREIKST